MSVRNSPVSKEKATCLTRRVAIARSQNMTNRSSTLSELQAELRAVQEIESSNNQWIQISAEEIVRAVEIRRIRTFTGKGYVQIWMGEEWITVNRPYAENVRELLQCDS